MRTKTIPHCLTDAPAGSQTILGATRLTVVDENVRAAAGPLVRLDACPPDVVRAREIDGDEGGLFLGKLLLLEDGEKRVVFGLAPRENRNRASCSELMRPPERKTRNRSEHQGMGG